jgi:hypothetical protein
MFEGVHCIWISVRWRRKCDVVGQKIMIIIYINNDEDRVSGLRRDL